MYIVYGMQQRETNSVAALVRAVFCAQPLLPPAQGVVCVHARELLLTCAGSLGANIINSPTYEIMYCAN